MVMKTKGFSLTELLLIIYSIIVLASIFIPNFLEARIHSRVAQCKADMRALSTAIETYFIFHNTKYPIIVAPNSSYARYHSGSIIGPSVFGTGHSGVSSRLIRLTTPIAFISKVCRDPFVLNNLGQILNPSSLNDTYDYADAASLWEGGILGGERGSGATSGAAWRISGCGPDVIQGYGGGMVFSGADFNDLGCDYDPTNGIISTGDIVKVGGGSFPNGGGGYLPAYDRILNKKNY